MTSVIAFLILIGVIITVHEFGHFAVAKLFGVKCEVFSIGFGRPLIKFQRGDTEYRLAWIPLGGYVRMLGQDPDQEPDSADVGKSLNDKSPFVRILIYLAGPAMNLLLPFLIIIPTVALSEKMATTTSSQVGAVDSSMPAYQGGLRGGDRIVQIDGQSVHAFWQIKRRFDQYAPEQGPVSIVVERPGEGRKNLSVTPKAVHKTHEFLGFKSTDYLIGYQVDFLDSTIGITDPKGSIALSGVRTFDRIISVDGQRTPRFVDVLHHLRMLEVGRKATLIIERLGTPIFPQLPVIKRKEHLEVAYVSKGRDTLGIGHSSTCVTTVDPNGPAKFLRPNDCLIAVDGQSYSLGAFLRTRLGDNPGQAKAIAWIRDGQRMEGTLSYAKEIQNHPMAGELPVWVRGFTLPQQPMVKSDPVASQERWSHGWYRARTDVPREIEVTARSISGMFTGQISPTQLSGPLTIFHLAGSAAEAGVDRFLRLMVLLSLSIGLFNLLPIPALDGGQILIASVEMVTRRPLPERAHIMLQNIGVILILALIIFALSNDAIRSWRLSNM